MTQPLVGKQILTAEDEQVFRSFPDSWFSSLGTTTVLAIDGADALELLGGLAPGLMIRDIAMPWMSGPKLPEYIRNRGSRAPILMISATGDMADITKALRLGVKDALLKPVGDLNRLREMVFVCPCPSMFNPRVEEEERPSCDWDAVVDNPVTTARLLQELQPPVQQVISRCWVNYRQLITADKPSLVSDIAALSKNDLVFYHLDVIRAGHSGVPVALLSRASFNGLLQEQLTHQNQRLPESDTLLKQVNHLLRQVSLLGRSPLLADYYHRELRNLILVSAGLNAMLDIGEYQVRISNGVPLGILGNAHSNQLGQRCDAW